MKTLPAEWHPQSCIQLTWPHRNTDWNYIYDEAIACFRNIAKEISSRQHLLIACTDIEAVRFDLNGIPQDNISIIETGNDDTWARDHAGITILNNGVPEVLDFTFNGWGEKYPSENDNLITQKLGKAGVFSAAVSQGSAFILEGGSIESDGKGTIITTTACLLNKNRNAQLSQPEVEQVLKDTLGAKRILWLEHGYLAGDDTDSHIDMLARLVSENHITYVRCSDEQDEHYQSLAQMEAELMHLQTLTGEKYTLTALPMVPAIDFEGERLPGSYANFLIMNTAVLVPIYNVPTDDEALNVLSGVFPNHEIVGIDCSVLIKQHGSLHCCTMQFPIGAVKPKSNN